MNIDFTAINNISTVSKPSFLQETHTNQSNYYVNDNNVFNELEVIRKNIEKEKQEIKRIRSRYSRAERTKTEILKGIKQGQSIEQLFILAINYISDATEDETFKTQTIENLKSIYGHSFKNEYLLNDELKETLERYKKLEKAYNNATDIKDKKRIEYALLEHKDLLIRLNNLTIKNQ